MVGNARGGSVDFDASALTDEASDADLREFRRRSTSAMGAPTRRARAGRVVDSVIRVVFATFIALLTALTLWMLVPWPYGGPLANALAVAIIGLVGGGATLALILPVVQRWRSKRTWRAWHRLSRFADDNGLIFLPEAQGSLRGTMFRQGLRGRLVDVLMTPDDSFAIGTYAFTERDARSLGREQRHGFLRIKLVRPVPHLVLISTLGRGIRGYSSVGLSFAQRQRVRLEGDFDNTFAVYAPDGYGADARYVLTPDLMARLVDYAAAVDLEFIDDELFVYSAKPWNLERLQVWAWVSELMETVGASSVRRTSRFADDRSLEPGVTVAPQGRRLRIAIPLVAGAILVSWIAVQLARTVFLLAP